MKRYQAVLILKPDLDEKTFDDFRDGFKKLLKKGKATNVQVLEDDVRDLVHAIKKQPRAHFWRLGFEAPTSLVSELRQEIMHDERLLRQVYLDAGAEFAEQESEPETEPEVKPESATETESGAKPESTEKVEKKDEETKTVKQEEKAKEE